MDLIYTQTIENKKIEAGIIQKGSFDCEISDEAKDFALVTNYVKNSHLIDLMNEYIFLEKTEFGGLVTHRKIDKQSKNITLSGLSFRGYLDTKIVPVPPGQDFYLINGNLLDEVSKLFKNAFMPENWKIMEIEQINVTYQLNRYCTLLKALDDICKKYNLAMNFVYDDGVVFSIKKAENKAIELATEDIDNITLLLTQDANYPDVMIALGKGELKEREVIYLKSDGINVFQISKNNIEKGANMLVYDNSSTDNLLADARKKYYEILEGFKKGEKDRGYITNAEITSYEGEILKIGDVISVFEPILKIRSTSKVIGIIAKKENEKNEKISYKFMEVNNE